MTHDQRFFTVFNIEKHKEIFRVGEKDFHICLNELPTVRLVFHQFSQHIQSWISWLINTQHNDEIWIIFFLGGGEETWRIQTETFEVKRRLLTSYTLISSRPRKSNPGQRNGKRLKKIIKNQVTYLS